MAIPRLPNGTNGLYAPQTTGNTPLDKEFERLAIFLQLDPNSPDDALTQLAAKSTSSDTPTSAVTKINALLSHSFQRIFTIQKLAEDARLKDSDDPERSQIIPISLHDLKHYSDLINIIIAQVICPCLPAGVGVPLEQRRLKSFNDKSKVFQFKKVREGGNGVLIRTVELFQELFVHGGPLKDMLIKGPGLIDIITCLIVLIHTTGSDKYAQELSYFEEQSDTYNLISIYTSLLQSASSPTYKQFLSSKLSNITITRPNGVSSLIDFILGIRDEEEVNIEKFNHVNAILLAVPKGYTKVQYFKALFAQVYDILVNINRPVLQTATLNFVKRVYELNKRIVHDFLFRLVWKVLDPSVIEGGDDVVVNEKQLNDVINVLISLTKDTSVDFLNELFSKLFINLWSYLNYLKKNRLPYSDVVFNVLKSFFRITKNNDFMKDIILNLIRFEINDDFKFVTTIEYKLTRIEKKSVTDTAMKYTNEGFFDDMELGISNVVSLLKEIDDKSMIREQFLIVLNRWILQKTPEVGNEISEENPFLILIDLKLLEKMNDVFKDTLLEKPELLLSTINNILLVKAHGMGNDVLDEQKVDVDSDDEDSDDEDTGDNLSVLLELLSAIISETDPMVLKSKHESTLAEISTELRKFESNRHCTTLSKRIDEILHDDTSTGNNSKTLDDDDDGDDKARDQKLLENALTSMNDPLVPIRAHGLYLLRQLIVQKSKILSIENIIDLHLLQLRDTEPFIYLNVIKSLNELLEFNEVETLRVLMMYYFGKIDDKIQSEPDPALDDRLKIGEVLLNFIQRKNELLVSNPLLDDLIQGTINLINDFDNTDNRLRMSAMSLLGESLRTNAVGLTKFVSDSIDCAMGILELEKDVTMKRSAVVLINDLVCNDIKLIPRSYGDRLKTLLNFVKVNADDYLLVEQIHQLLENVNEMVKMRLTPGLELPKQFETLKINK